MKRLLTLVAASAAVLLLAGCAPSVSEQDFEQRFMIELAGQFGTTADDPAFADAFAQLGREAADDAVNDHLCGETAYESQLDGSTRYAWDVACLAVFEGDLTEAQQQRIRDEVAQEAGS